MKYPVLVMECVQKIVNGFNAVVTEKDKKKLAVFMQKLGFDDISATFYDLSLEKKEKKVNDLMLIHACIPLTVTSGSSTYPLSSKGASHLSVLLGDRVVSV